MKSKQIVLYTTAVFLAGLSIYAIIFSDFTYVSDIGNIITTPYKIELFENKIEVNNNITQLKQPEYEYYGPTQEPQKINVALFVPTTSRVSPGLTYCATCMDFFVNVLDGFLQYLPSNDKRYSYTIYVGYDDGDLLWDNAERLASITKVVLQLIKPKGFKFVPVKIMRYPNPEKGSITNVWNKLSERAIKDNNDYFFLANDDLKIYTNDFIHKLVTALANNKYFPGLGEAAPKDINFDVPTHPTFPLVSRVHFDIFGEMYSTKIFSRGCDTWLGDVYRGFNSVFYLQTVLVGNQVSGQIRRYENDFDENVYKQLVVEGRRKIHAYLQKHNIRAPIGGWKLDLCNVPHTYGCS